MSGSQSAMARLRSETRECHVTTERAPLARAMARGELSMEEYVAHLRAYERVYDALESTLERSADARVHAVFQADMRKTPLLRSDLAALARAKRPALAVPTEALRRYVGALAAEGADGAALLGSLYVFEGSTLGGAVLLPRIAAGLGLPADETRFYAGYGEATMTHWAAFSARMNAALADEASQRIAVDAARRTFDGLRDVFDEITSVTREAASGVTSAASLARTG